MFNEEMRRLPLNMLQNGGTLKMVLSGTKFVKSRQTMHICLINIGDYSKIGLNTVNSFFAGADRPLVCKQLAFQMFEW